MQLSLMVDVRKICLEYKLQVQIVLSFICYIYVFSVKLYCCIHLDTSRYKTVAVAQVAGEVD